MVNILRFSGLSNFNKSHYPRDITATYLKGVKYLHITQETSLATDSSLKCKNISEHGECD